MISTAAEEPTNKYIPTYLEYICGRAMRAKVERIEVRDCERPKNSVRAY